MRQLLGALSSLCLVVQPLLMRLHLALEDHITGSGQVAIDTAPHTHPHGHTHGHRHPHVHVHGTAADDDIGEAEGADRGSHPPHPAGDHLHQQQHHFPAPPTSCFGALLLTPEPDFEIWDALPAARVSQDEPRIPLRPPPRAPAQPRAPPAIV